MVSSAYLRLLIFLPVILIPACASSSPAFLMMYSAYKLNKHWVRIEYISRKSDGFLFWTNSGLLLDSQNHLECNISSVQFSHSVMSDSLTPHESQHARPPCPSPTPRVHSESHPLSQWFHPAITSSVVPFSSCLLSSIRVFPVSQLFTWGGHSIGASASASVLPVSIRVDFL